MSCVTPRLDVMAMDAIKLLKIRPRDKWQLARKLKCKVDRITNVISCARWNHGAKIECETGSVYRLVEK